MFQGGRPCFASKVCWVRFPFPPLEGIVKKRKDKPIGGGHCLENSSELTTRVGSTPTLSAIVGIAM